MADGLKRYVVECEYVPKLFVQSTTKGFTCSGRPVLRGRSDMFCVVLCV